MTNLQPDKPADLLAAALRADPAGPLLTFYDDAAGERVELSATTLDNWVAKTANLFRDGLAVEPGASVGVLLPPHWQVAVALLAAWSVGAEVCPGEGTADVVLAAEDRLAEVTRDGAAGREVLGFSLAPMGRPMSAPHAGVTDFAADVRSHADRFAPYDPVDPDAPALCGASGRGVVERARARAGELDLSAGDRVLTTLGPDSAGAIVDGLLAPLAAGASIVLCRNLDPAALEHRVRMERVTVRIGA